MSQPEPRPEFAAIVRVARASGVETELVIECIERRLVAAPGMAAAARDADERAPDTDPDDDNEGLRWEQEAVEEMMRVRRLRALGVNMPGLEVISHMRRRMLAMRAVRDELRREIETLRREIGG